MGSTCATKHQLVRHHEEIIKKQEAQTNSARQHLYANRNSQNIGFCSPLNPAPIKRQRNPFVNSPGKEYLKQQSQEKQLQEHLKRNNRKNKEKNLKYEKAQNRNDKVPKQQKQNIHILPPYPNQSIVHIDISNIQAAQKLDKQNKKIKQIIKQLQNIFPSVHKIQNLAQPTPTPREIQAKY